MKKILLIITMPFLLISCTEKQDYKEAVLEQMKNEQDLKDYHIDPEVMTDCVVDLSSEKMPGFNAIDPYKREAYRNYITMLSMSTAEDKQAKLKELRSLFGSPKKLANAHSNYTESVMDCLASIIAKSEEAQKEKELEATTD